MKKYAGRGLPKCKVQDITMVDMLDGATPKSSLKRRMYVIVMLLSVAAMLSACQSTDAYSHIAPDYAAIEEAMRSPGGVTLRMLDRGLNQDLNMRSSKVGSEDDISYPELQRMDLPPGTTPLGMLDTEHGYILDEHRSQVLWLYDYGRDSRQPIVDLRDSAGGLGHEIAFSADWLIWLELDAYQQQDDGLKRRDVRLMARDLRQGDAAEDFVIDETTISAADGHSLPFDSLSLDGSILVYRYAQLEGGWRDTHVKAVQLQTRERKILASASEAAGRQITRCSVAGQMIVWDVQMGYQLQITELAELQQARYSLYCYQLDDIGNSRLNGTEQLLCREGHYYAPLAHGEEIIALLQIELRREWVQIFDSPIIYRDNQQIYRNLIVQINPISGTAQTRVRNTGYSSRYLNHFASRNLSVSVQRDSLFIGKRLLSWQSNIGEQHIVYDFHSSCFLELPIYFAQTAAVVSDDVPLGIWMRPIPGLDADYLLFGLVSAAEAPYLLRLE